MLLEIKDLVVGYGRVTALHGISLDVGEGEIVALIGSNGAGKTTTMRAVSGLSRPSAGSVALAGRPVTALRPDERVALGVALVPEGRGVFPAMTVHENLLMGAYLRRDHAGIDDDLERVHGLFPRLVERSGQPAGGMSGGEQQMLAVARALMSRPRLLLLDEPSMGLAPQLVRQVFDLVREINRQGTAVLIVEQNAAQALAIADRAYVLESGAIVTSGEGSRLLDDPSVRHAYLGPA